MILLARISSRRVLASRHLVAAFRLNPPRYIGQDAKSKSPSVPKTREYASRKAAYRERVLIYHSGVGRTAFLGSLKLTTIFIFAFFSLVLAPAHFYSEDEPSWVAPAVLLCGTIPMVAVAYLTSPFVNYIHLRLPSFARHSRDMLIRYSKNPPKDAQLDMTTMNFIGLPRVSRVDIHELKPTKQRLGTANYARDTQEVNATRPWWMGNAARLFGVYSGTGKVREGEAWENIAKRINRST